MLEVGRLPTVPEYYEEFIDSKVDLVLNPKQCCPFHKEDIPSFSFNIPTGRWSCFGQCHAHGDVIEMHRRWFHFTTREEAESDLNKRCNIRELTPAEKISKLNTPILVSEEQVENNVAYVEACMLANCPSRWIELDYVLSKTPFDRLELETLIIKWKGENILD